MNEEYSKEWRFSLLKEILKAISKHDFLAKKLVFKGAHILNKHLGTDRRSLDLDSNLVELQVTRDEEAKLLEVAISEALINYFENQEIVRFSLVQVKVTKNPRREHPRGWDAFEAKIKVTDANNSDVLHLPTLKIDIAAPEKLSESSITNLDYEGVSVRAYSLSRVAGEKLRAWLSSLPEYNHKIGRPREVPRVKDLYDLHRILEARPITNNDFWSQAAMEFRTACESRYIDCKSRETFFQGWNDNVPMQYSQNQDLSDVPFEITTESLETIVDYLESKTVFPFSFQLPKLEKG